MADGGMHGAISKAYDRERKRRAREATREREQGFEGWCACVHGPMRTSQGLPGR